MKMIMTAVIATMLVFPARAADTAAPAPGKTGWAGFFKNLKDALAQSAVSGQRKKGRGAQAVASVRGEDQDWKDPNEPGLKGDVKAAKAKKEQAYDKELYASVELLSQGKPQEALKGFEAFKAAHPKYRTEDVDKAIEGAKVMIAETGGEKAADAEQP